MTENHKLNILFPLCLAESNKDEVDWPEEEIDYKTLSIDRLRKIINKEGPYYPKFENSENAYRDGYIKEAPKKPRASYLFFQGTIRSFHQIYFGRYR